MYNIIHIVYVYITIHVQKWFFSAHFDFGTWGDEAKAHDSNLCDDDLWDQQYFACKSIVIKVV